MRQPNELWISTDLMEELYHVGFKSSPYRVKEGPSADAKIIGVYLDARFRCIVLQYDRAVDEAILTTESLSAAA